MTRTLPSALPADRIEIARLTVHGDADATFAIEPLKWHRLRGPDASIVLVLSRPSSPHEHEIFLDYEGNRVDENTRGARFVYPGAHTLTEARIAHHAWRAWRRAEQMSLGKSPTVTTEEVDQLRELYENIANSLAARLATEPPASGT